MTNKHAHNKYPFHNKDGEYQNHVFSWNLRLGQFPDPSPGVRMFAYTLACSCKCQCRKETEVRIEARWVSDRGLIPHPQACSGLCTKHREEPSLLLLNHLRQNYKYWFHGLIRETSIPGLDVIYIDAAQSVWNITLLPQCMGKVPIWDLVGYSLQGNLLILHVICCNPSARYIYILVNLNNVTFHRSHSTDTKWEETKP